MDEYELTLHARQVMAQREISLEWMKQVLASPDRTERDGHDPELIHVMGRIAEYGNRVLRVVYNPSSNPRRIVTLFFDRGQKGEP